MKPTIKDIAKKADVSIATVSYVINGTKSISPETRKRVLRTIKSLDYHPSKSARNLVTGNTGNIGFILTDDHFLRTEPFYTKIFLGTEFEARSEGYYILLTSIKSDFDRKDILPRFVLNNSVDGIIIAGKISHDLIEKLSSYKLPTVFVDYIPPSNGYPLVLIDNIQGGIMAVNHLIELGHKNIAFISSDIEHPSFADRLNGYRQALENAKIPVRNNLIYTKSIYQGRQAGFDLTKRLFSHNRETTAIFTGNDAMAIGAIHFLKTKGYKVPEDVSVIGFDGIEADLMLDPPLSTISVPKIELGIEALKLLINTLKNKKAFPKKIIVPVELIKRESTSYCKSK
jgi:LacI family transcriptional regulator